MSNFFAANALRLVIVLLPFDSKYAIDLLIFIGTVLLRLTSSRIFAFFPTAPPHRVYFSIFTTMSIATPFKISFLREIFAAIYTELGICIKVLPFATHFDFIQFRFKPISLLFNSNQSFIQNGHFMDLILLLYRQFLSFAIKQTSPLFEYHGPPFFLLLYLICFFLYV